MYDHDIVSAQRTTSRWIDLAPFESPHVFRPVQGKGFLLAINVAIALLAIRTPQVIAADPDCHLLELPDTTTSWYGDPFVRRDFLLNEVAIEAVALPDVNPPPAASAPLVTNPTPCEVPPPLNGGMICPAVRQEFYVYVTAAKDVEIAAVEFRMVDADTGTEITSWRPAELHTDGVVGDSVQGWYLAVVEYEHVEDSSQIEVQFQATDTAGMSGSLDPPVSIDMCVNPILDDCTDNNIDWIEYAAYFNDVNDGQYGLRITFPQEPFFEDSINIPLLGDLQNRLAGNVAITALLDRGEWYPQSAESRLDATLLGQSLISKTVELGLDNEGASFACGELALRLSRSDIDVFHEDWAWELFDGTLYAGTIGPIPIRVTASLDVGLGVDVAADARVEFAYPGPPTLEARLDIDPVVSPWLEGSVSVRVLEGLARATGTLRAEADLNLPVSVTITDTEPPIPDTGDFCFDFQLSAKGEACLTFFCYESGWIEIIDTPGSCSNRSATSVSAALGGFPEVRLKTPAIAVSPDGLRTLIVYIRNNSPPGSDEFRGDTTFVEDAGTGYSPARPMEGGPDDHLQLDTNISFVSNSRALAVWTENRLTETMEATMLPSVADFNTVFENKDIAYSVWNAGSGWGPRMFVRDDTAVGTLRSDGLPVVVGLNGQDAALVAWVRYGGTVLFNAATGSADKTRMSVVATRVNLTTGPDPLTNVSALNEPVPALDTEPAIAASPNGQRGLLVWVRDQDGDEATASDRSLMAANWTPAAGWTMPQEIVTSYPGVNMPSAVLKNNGHALIAFGAPKVQGGVVASNTNKDHIFVLERRSGIWQTPQQLHIDATVRSGEFYGREPRALFLDDNTAAVVCRNYDGFGRDGGDGELSVAVGDLRPENVSYWSEVRDLTNDSVRDWEIAAARAGPGRIRTVRDRGDGPLVYDGLVFQDISGFTADVKVEELLFDRYRPAGSPQFVRARLKNVGLGWLTTPEMTTVRFGTVDAEGVFTERARQELLFSLRPDETVDVASIYFAPAQLTTLRVVVDSLSSETEGVQLENNELDASIGVAPPTNLAANTTLATAGVDVLLTWKNADAYEEIRVYRNGLELWSMPGITRSSKDGNRPPGTYTWALKGRVENAWSAETQITVIIPEDSDCDVDGGIDLRDFSHWVSCLTGPDIGSLDPGCTCADPGSDGDVDLHDLASLLADYGAP